MASGSRPCVVPSVIRVPISIRVGCRVMRHGIWRPAKWRGKEKPFLKSAYRSKIPRGTAIGRCTILSSISAPTRSWVGPGLPGSAELRRPGRRWKPAHSSRPGWIPAQPVPRAAPREIPPDVTEVRIMSLHKSKGLSSPIVVTWPDPDRARTWRASRPYRRSPIGPLRGRLVPLTTISTCRPNLSENRPAARANRARAFSAPYRTAISAGSGST